MGLQQINCTVSNRNLLDLVFTSVTESDAKLAIYCLVLQDDYHPLLSINLEVKLSYSTHGQQCSFLNYAQGDYLHVYTSLYNYDWSCVYQAININTYAWTVAFTRTIRA